MGLLFNATQSIQKFTKLINKRHGLNSQILVHTLFPVESLFMELLFCQMLPMMPRIVLIDI